MFAATPVPTFVVASCGCGTADCRPTLPACFLAKILRVPPAFFCVFVSRRCRYTRAVIRSTRDSLPARVLFVGSGKLRRVRGSGLERRLSLAWFSHLEGRSASVVSRNSDVGENIAPLACDPRHPLPHSNTGKIANELLHVVDQLIITIIITYLPQQTNTIHQYLGMLCALSWRLFNRHDTTTRTRTPRARIKEKTMRVPSHPVL